MQVLHKHFLASKRQVCDMQLQDETPRYKLKVSNKYVNLLCTFKGCKLRVPFSFEWSQPEQEEAQARPTKITVLQNTAFCWHTYPLH
jgi:hypothetical protein